MSPGSATIPRPRKKTFKILSTRIFMFCLGRGFQTAAALDKDIRQETDAWPEGFTVLMKVLPHGPCLVMKKTDGKIRYKGGQEPARVDLAVFFKNLEAGYRVMTGQMSTPQASAEHRTLIKGDLTEGMRLIRCLNAVLAYMFPKVISRRLLKRVPAMTVGRMVNRGIIYVFGIPLGKP